MRGGEAVGRREAVGHPLAEFRRLVQAAAMDGQRRGQAVARHAGDGVERHGNALERVEVAEIGEGAARRAGGEGARRRRLDGRTAVGHHLDAGGIETPGDIAVAQEAAGRQEAVDQPEHRLDVLLAQQELVGRPVGEATVAGIRRRLAAKGPRFAAIATLAARRRDHLTVVGADRVIVVQGVDDLRIRADAADQEQHLHAQQQRVMHMHDVRPEGAQQVGQVGHQPVQVDLALVEMVEMAGPQQHLVGAAAQRLEPGAGTRRAVGVVGAGQEQALRPRRLQAAEQLMREDLGAAGMQARVVVRDQQHPRRPGGHQRTRRLARSRTGCGMTGQDQRKAAPAHGAVPFSRTSRSWKFSASRWPLQCPRITGSVVRSPWAAKRPSRNSSS